MMAVSGRTSKWLAFSITLAVATFSAASAAISGKSRLDAKKKIRELEMSLKSSQEKCAAERQGRIRAQQALRTALHTTSENLEFPSFPMAPIAVVRSCFSTRNGTPRQPLLVPLARARLEFDPARVPPSSLEGLAEYSHCWIIYVFHLNTDLEKLWKHPSKSKFKAKVRVPRLKGGRRGVFATRSPHRPCPIGLTVAKVEAVQDHMVLLSGVDLVDGTPILDIKPYLPYCDSIQEATVPMWVKADNSLAVASVDFSEGFFSSLAGCWSKLEKKSLYASSDEFQCLVKQVLSWDIRSISQQTRPHNIQIDTENGRNVENSAINPDVYLDQAASSKKDRVPLPAGDIIYHLILESLDVSYRIDSGGNVMAEEVSFSSRVPENYGNSEDSPQES